MSMAEQRKKRAQDYAERHNNPRGWYSKKANRNKRAFRLLGLSIILLGAVIAVIPILLSEAASGPSPSDITVAILGALVVILKGAERLWLPEETWMAYRKAAESLKLETEAYIEGVGVYECEEEEEPVFKRYVQRCMQIRDHEKQLFWTLQSQRKNDPGEDAQQDTSPQHK